MKFIHGYWGKSWKLYSNWVLGFSGTMQLAITGTVALQAQGIVTYPPTMLSYAGYAVATFTFLGIALRGIQQTVDQAALDEAQAAALDKAQLAVDAAQDAQAATTEVVTGTQP